MPATLHVGRRTVNQTVGCLVVALFLLAVESVSATTYVSAEPIPSEDVVGFTQIDFAGSSTNNSMLFLKPAASKHRLASGLFEAVETEPRATYSPLKNNDTPTTARAGVAFPGNDWLALPNGDDYLVNIGDSSQLRDDLALLRQRHLDDVALLLDAIANNRVEAFLGAGFSCSD